MGRPATLRIRGVRPHLAPYTENVSAASDTLAESAGRQPSVGTSRRPARRLEVAAIKSDFPVLDRQEGDDLVFLDSAASSQKPIAVIEAMDHYYRTSHANVHRGVYRLAEQATNLYEAARSKVGRFVGASDPSREIVFTKNATEALNLAVRSWGRANLRQGDAVLLTEIEHHANLVPWLMLAEEIGVELRYLRVMSDGELDLSQLEQKMTGARVVSFTLCSNVLGTLVPVEPIVSAARAAGATVIADGAQFVPHMRTNVRELGIDMLAFTGHKMLGPTGVGVLWGKAEVLESMPPFLGGGEMISDVRLDGFTPAELPLKFEAGTPPIAEAIGLGAAVDYLDGLGMEAVRAHELQLVEYAKRRLAEDHGDRLKIHGPQDPERRGGVLSMELEGVHAHDLSQVLDSRGVCIRAGHHCAKPLMRCLRVGATARASLYVYNDESDVDALSAALSEASAFFGLR